MGEVRTAESVIARFIVGAFLKVLRNRNEVAPVIGQSDSGHCCPASVPFCYGITLAAAPIMMHSAPALASGPLNEEIDNLSGECQRGVVRPLDASAVHQTR